MIGYFGGTFDPIHDGHIFLASETQRRYHFSRFLFVPTGQNPHKPSPSAAAPAYRLEMCAAVTQSLGREFETLAWETESPGPHFTVDTVTRLKSESRQEITVILGNEVFSALPRWKDPRRLLEAANLVVVTREAEPDIVTTLLACGVRDVTPATGSSGRSTHSGNRRWVDLFPLDALPLSATELRESIRKIWNSGELSRRPQGLPTAAWEIIKKRRLYAV